MIRSLQKRFITAAMIAVSVLLLVLLGAINVVNAWSSLGQTDSLLDALTESETGRPPRLDNKGTRGLLRPPLTENSKMSALFFTVTANSEGEIFRTDLSRIASVSEEEACRLFTQVFGKQREGRIQSFRYRTVSLADDRGTVTIFLDESTQHYSVLRVAILSIFAGLVCWGLMLLLVIFLSKKAIRPIAENMEKQKQFVTDAGHEIKTPLAIILANTDAMELRGGESKYSRNIRAQVMRLNTLMQNLLTLARADESRVAPDTEEFSLTGLCTETMAMFAEAAELKKLHVTSRLQDGVQIRANRQQIAQLLSILIDNAVKYTPGGGSIDLRLEQSDRARLQIRNTVENTDVRQNGSLTASTGRTAPETKRPAAAASASPPPEPLRSCTRAASPPPTRAATASYSRLPYKKGLSLHGTDPSFYSSMCSMPWLTMVRTWSSARE